jgi:predicted MPP superfamily phosphohydrolase
MRFVLFATAFVGVFLLLNLYIYRRFIKRIDLHHKIKRYLALFLVINFLGIVGYMVARYYPTLPNWLFFLLSVPIGVLFLLFCTAVIYDISRLALERVPLSHERRRFFKKSLDLSSLSLSFALSAQALYSARYIEIEEVAIRLKKLKKSYTVAQLSDIHIGGLIDRAYIAEMVERVNRLKPDVVVITGDLVDAPLKHAAAALEELTKLQSTHGTYFIVGNHEYFHGVERIIDRVTELGIRVLENEHAYIGEAGSGFNLAGVYDLIGYRVGHHEPNIVKAIKDRDQSVPTVLLAHQPKFIHETIGCDLLLCGHTHGGQIYPFRALVSLAQPYISGLYQHDAHTQIYVNKGTGFWGPPMRLGASSEITKITLHG